MGAALRVHDAERDPTETERSLHAAVAELRQQVDSLVVKHAVLSITIQELLRRADLPTARELSRTVPARVASLMQAVDGDDGAAGAQEAAIEELQGLLLYALCR